MFYPVKGMQAPKIVMTMSFLVSLWTMCHYVMFMIPVDYRLGKDRYGTVHLDRRFWVCAFGVQPLQQAPSTPHF